MTDVRDMVPELLREIRDEIKGMRSELVDTNSKIDYNTSMIERNTSMIERSTERIDELAKWQMKMASEMTEMKGLQIDMVKAMGGLLREFKGMNQRIDNILTGPVRGEIESLKARVEQLEQKAHSH